MEAIGLVAALMPLVNAINTIASISTKLSADDQHSLTVNSIQAEAENVKEEAARVLANQGLRPEQGNAKSEETNPVVLSAQDIYRFATEVLARLEGLGEETGRTTIRSAIQGLSITSEHHGLQSHERTQISSSSPKKLGEYEFPSFSMALAGVTGRLFPMLSR